MASDSIVKLLDGYELFVPPIARNYRDWKPKQAKEYFDWLMAIKDDRLALLERTIGLNQPRETSERFALDYSPRSFRILGKWLGENARVRPLTAAEHHKFCDTLPDLFMRDIGVSDWIHDAQTISLCEDAGIYFAEALIRRHRGVYWDYLRRPRNAGNFQQPALFGFRGGDCMEPTSVVANSLGDPQDWPNAGEEFQRVFHVWESFVDPAL